MFEARERTTGGSRAVADVAAELARLFMVAPAPPTRIPTVRELARVHGSSPASIHSAISRLIDTEAISIETRGRLGAFLVGRSMGRLWAAAVGGPLVVSLPLASSIRYEALATALKRQLTAAGLDVFLIFVRGSRQRLQAVREGRCHLAVMSSFAAVELCGPNEVVVLELPRQSYNTGHRVFYAQPPEERPLRVIIDPYSADQQLLSALEFEDTKVEFVPAMGGQITRLLDSDQADAAVWTVDEMQVRRPDRILDRPLRRAVRDAIGDRDTRASLVCPATMAPTLRALTAVINRDQVTAIQRDVIAGRIVPEY